MQRSSYLLLVGLFVITWSSAFPAAKLAIQAGPPLLFLAVRFGLATALLLAAAAATGKLRGPVPWLSLMGLGVINVACNQGLSWLGMRTVSGGLATIISSLNPVLVAVLAVPFLGERLTGRKLAGLAFGLAGAAFVVRNRIVVTGEDPAGITFLFVGMIAFTFGTLLYKRIAPGTGLLVSVALQQGGASLALLIAGLALGERFDAFVPGPLPRRHHALVRAGDLDQRLSSLVLPAPPRHRRRRRLPSLPDAAPRPADELGGPWRNPSSARSSRRDPRGARHSPRYHLSRHLPVAHIRLATT